MYKNNKQERTIVQDKFHFMVNKRMKDETPIGEIVVNNNPDCLDEETLAKVNELREKRNNYNNLASDVQKQIDQIIMDFHDYNSLVGKYLKVTNSQSGSIEYIGKITKVDRLMSASCRVYSERRIDLVDGSFEFIVFERNADTTLGKIFGNGKNEYETITKEEFDQIAEEAYNSFINN